MGEFETILNANTAIKDTLNSFYHASHISEFQATLNANAQLTKNTSHLLYHTSQIGEFETILNANAAVNNTLIHFTTHHR